MVSQTVSQNLFSTVPFRKLPFGNGREIVRVFRKRPETLGANKNLKALAMTQLLKFEDVQARLQLSRSTINRLIKQGLIERIYVLGAPRFADTEVERFITSQIRTNRRKQVGL